MIQVYRNTLTRLDLSSVLTHMVDNSLDGDTTGEHLAKECAQRMHYDIAMSFRSPIDALSVALSIARSEMKKATKQLLLLPVLAPAAFIQTVNRHEHTSVKYYDIDESFIEPSDNEIEKLHVCTNTYENIVFVRHLHFGVESKRKTIDEHLQKKKCIFTIDVKYIPSKEENMLSDKKSENTPNTTEYPTDMSIVLCEQNTLFTSGGGAILCVRGKRLSKALRTYKRHIHTYMSQWIHLSDMNAALALTQLAQLNIFTERVREISKVFIDSLQTSRHSILMGASHPNSLLQTLPLCIASRKKELFVFALKQGVEIINAFRYSILEMLHSEHDNKETILQTQNEFPNATAGFSKVVCFPLYPSLDNDEVSTISKILTALP